MYARSAAALMVAVIFGTGVGWAQTLYERHFRLEWEAGQARNGRPTVTGYLYNTHPTLAARSIQLLVEQLDPSGQVVSKTLKYVDDEIPPAGRAYFEVPVPAAATYRVLVQYSDWRSLGR